MMVDEKLIKLLGFYAHGDKHKLPDDAYAAKTCGRSLDDLGNVLRHARWMAEQAIGFLKEAETLEVNAMDSHSPFSKAMHDGQSKREKAHRWLGFVQCAFWLTGVFSLDELKEHSRRCSDDPDKAEGGR